MTIFLWIITAIVIFTIIVLAHELGHFWTARKFNVKVHEFWLWLPPKVKKLWTDKKWTEYTLNAFPLWWFVRLAWENIHTFDLYDKDWKLHNIESLEVAIKKKIKVFDAHWETVDKDDLIQIKQALQENNADYSLINKPIWQQTIVILAGVFMNLLLAAIVFSVLFYAWVKPLWINTKIQTDLDLKLIPNTEQAIESWILIKKIWVFISPLKESVATKAWLMDWDLVLKVNNNNIEDYKDFQTIIKNNPDTKLSLELHRYKSKTSEEFDTLFVDVVPKKDEETWNGLIWSYIFPNLDINRDFEYKYPLWEAIKLGAKETINQSLLTVSALSMILRKIIVPKTKSERTEALNSISGPIGVVDIMAKWLEAWIVFIIILWAIISINLWVFNLLPIPALDWGRFLFLMINWIILKLFWKKAINEKLENMLHVWFFIFLIILSILIAYNDIAKIVWS